MKTCSNSAHNTLVTPAMHKVVEKLVQRELTIPLLLYLVGHKPLAFVTGQLFYLCLPIAALTGLPQLEDWARLLSDPAGPMQLETLLRNQTQSQRVLL